MAMGGYPIVDGKYLDKDGNIRETGPNEWTTSGPLALYSTGKSLRQKISFGS